MILHVHMKDLETLVWFGVVKELAVGILVVSSVIDRYVRGIFPP